MGWAARRNLVAQEAKAGRMAPRPAKAAKPVSRGADAWLNSWWAMWDRAHGILVDIQPRVNPLDVR